MVSLRSPVSAIHARVQHNIVDASLFSIWRTLSYLWRDVSALARLFLGWRNFFLLSGATFFRPPGATLLLTELLFTWCDFFVGRLSFLWCPAAAARFMHLCPEMQANEIQCSL